mmetsp:Transcript_92086/g.298110  ORF Transcript_92086/g.298110 Transcript_92086/m.298110 type:complete len:247 (+) Transcript_92086:1120-1860(+)
MQRSTSCARVLRPGSLLWPSGTGGTRQKITRRIMGGTDANMSTMLYGFFRKRQVLEDTIKRKSTSNVKATSKAVSNIVAPMPPESGDGRTLCIVVMATVTTMNGSQVRENHNAALLDSGSSRKFQTFAWKCVRARSCRRRMNSARVWVLQLLRTRKARDFSPWGEICSDGGDGSEGSPVVRSSKLLDLGVQGGFMLHMIDQAGKSGGASFGAATSPVGLPCASLSAPSSPLSTSLWGGGVRDGSAA